MIRAPNKPKIIDPPPSGCIHPDGRDVLVLQIVATGQWLRHPEPTADIPSGVPRFATAEEALRWCEAEGAERLGGSSVAIVHLLDHFALEVTRVPKVSIIRGPRHPRVTAERSVPAPPSEAPAPVSNADSAKSA